MMEMGTKKASRAQTRKYDLSSFKLSLARD